MKIYVDRDELWPFYIVNLEDAITEAQKKYCKEVEVDEEFLKEHSEAMFAFAKVQNRLSGMFGDE